MKVAIIGLPGSGKSTLFSAVTGQASDPYAPPGIRQGVVRVPDARLSFLTTLCRPKKTTEATIEFVDVPGCSLDDAGGQDQWRQFLPEVRRAELLVLVIREFENASVAPFRDRIDGRADLDALYEELIFADLDTVSTRIDRIEKALKKPTKTHEQEKRELGVLVRCREALEAGDPLSKVLTGEEDRRQVASFAFLTEKPLLAVRNISEGASAGTAWHLNWLRGEVSLCADVENELARLEPDERSVFMEEMGLKESARDALIRMCYEGCGLISFLTMGPDEVRAWTIPQGATAVDAASKIHTDLARGFIRAETVSFADLEEAKDMKSAKAAGRVRKEGKGYVVLDGDIMNILAST